MANRTKEATVDRNKESTILTDTFYPTVAKNLSNTANANKFFRYVAEYRNRNIDILSNPLPVKFLIFLRDGEDANIIFRTCGIDRKELSLKIKEVRKFLVLDKVASADSDAIDISVALIFMMKYIMSSASLSNCFRLSIHSGRACPMMLRRKKSATNSR